MALTERRVGHSKTQEIFSFPSKINERRSRGGHATKLPHTTKESMFTLPIHLERPFPTAQERAAARTSKSPERVVSAFTCINTRLIPQKAIKAPNRSLL